MACVNDEGVKILFCDELNEPKKSSVDTSWIWDFPIIKSAPVDTDDSVRTHKAIEKVEEWFYDGQREYYDNDPCKKCGSRMYTQYFNDVFTRQCGWVREICNCRKIAIKAREAKPKIKLIDRRREWNITNCRYRIIMNYKRFSSIDICLSFDFWRKARQCWRINRQPS